MKNMKVLCIGSVTKDIFFPVKGATIIDTPDDLLSQKKIAFELGAKLHSDGRHETLGGCAVNVASGLARLGEEAGCYVLVGDDEIGNWAKKEIVKSKIDIGLFKTFPGIYSDLSAIVVDENTGERTIFSNHSASEKFEVEKNEIGNPEWIFISDLSGDWKKNLDTIIAVAKEKKIYLAFNPRQKALENDIQKNIQAISVMDILFVNKDEAINIISSKEGDGQNERLNDEKYLIEELKKIGPKVVALTDGIRGAWGFDGEQLLHVDALLRKAVDSTGAGDAFASGFLAAYLKNKNLEDCLKWGIINSSNSVTEYGGQKGLLTQEEINLKIQEVSVKSIS